MTGLLISILCMCGAFIQRSIGFGFGIFVLTVLPYLMPSYAEATALSSIMAMLTSLMVMWRMRHYMDWHKLWFVFLVFIIVAWFCIGLVSVTDQKLMKQILGGMLIASSIWFMFLSKHVQVKPTKTVQAIVGVLSGVMGGLFSMQGPPVVIYFLACAKSKEQYISLTQTYFVMGNFLMTVIRAGHGMITPTVLTDILFALPGGLIGVWLGAKAFKVMPMDLIRKIVYLYIALSGVIALL